MVRAHHPGAKAVPTRAVSPSAGHAGAAGAPVARVPRAGASGNDVTTGDPLYVKARRGVVLGSCAMADCLVNGRIAGQKAAAADPVA